MNTMKPGKLISKLLLTMAVLFGSAIGCFTATAQTQSPDSSVNIIKALEQSGKVKLRLPDKLVLRLEKVEDPEALSAENEEENFNVSQPVRRAGYRILVFDDNNPRTAQAEAQGRKRLMESRFSQYRTYVSFDSPYWKVKVGDFRTRGEAENALSEIREAIPSMARNLRIVRDRIN